MTFPALDTADVAAFEHDGYVLKRGFFDAEEVDLLRRAVDADAGLRANAVAVDDAQGGSTELALWNHPGDDLFGAIARCERIVGGMERLLGGEVYHYHSKLTMKHPGGGGAWNWHQDYGYWYQNGCLFPDLATVAIAVDSSTRENGCLEVMRGSHLLGRLEHDFVGGQTGADPARVAEALKLLERVAVEQQPGDALFFHCNTLHCSAPNASGQRRYLLLCCYNRASNDPFLDHHHPGYTPLEKLPDSAIKEIGLRGLGQSRAYMAAADDKTSKATDV